MSLDKSISSGHEHRKPYHGAKAIDPSCRNHGTDDWATENRLYASKKREFAMRQKAIDNNSEER